MAQRSDSPVQDIHNTESRLKQKTCKHPCGDDHPLRLAVIIITVRRFCGAPQHIPHIKLLVK